MSERAGATPVDVGDSSSQEGWLVGWGWLVV